MNWSIDQLRLLEKELTGQGKALIRNILKQKMLAFKANLLTRFHDVDELEAELEQAVYTKIPNPFVLHDEEENMQQLQPLASKQGELRVNGSLWKQ